MSVAAAPPLPAVDSNRLRATGVVLSSTLGNALSLTPTVTAVFGVFLVSIAMEFHWSRAEVSGALAVMSVATALSYPLAGWLCDLAGARRTALVGAAALGLMIVSLAFTRAQPALYYVQFAILGVVGSLPSAVTYGKLLSEWFEKRRGLWMGLSGGAGNGLGVTLLPLLSGAVIGPLGWRSAFICIGLLVLLVGLPLQALFLAEAPGMRRTDRPIKSADLEGLTLRQALRKPDFWLLLTSLPIGGGVLMAAAASIVPLLMDRGLPLGLATGSVACMGLACSACEPIIGYCLDRSGRPRFLCPLFLVAILGLALLQTGRGPMVLLAGVIIGIGMAGEFSALSFLTSRYFGRKALGRISGVAFGVVLVVHSIAMVAFNAIFDATHSYLWGLIAITPLLLWNTVAPGFLGKYPFTERTDAPVALAE